MLGQDAGKVLPRSAVAGEGVGEDSMPFAGVTAHTLTMKELIALVGMPHRTLTPRGNNGVSPSATP